MTPLKSFLMCCVIAICLISTLTLSLCVGLSYVLPDSGLVTYYEEFQFYIYGRDLTTVFTSALLFSLVSVYPSIRFSNKLDTL